MCLLRKLQPSQFDGGYVHRRAPGPCDTVGVAAHITLAGDLNGEYVVDEVLDDGRLVTRPDTSARAIHRRQGLEPISAEEFEQHVGHLPIDQEG